MNKHEIEATLGKHEIETNLRELNKTKEGLIKEKLRLEIKMQYATDPTQYNEQIDIITDEIVELDIKIQEGQAELDKIIATERNAAIERLREQRMKDARAKADEFNLPTGNSNIAILCIKGMAEKLQYQIIAGEDRLFNLQQLALREDADANNDSTLPNLGDHRKRYEDAIEEQEEIETLIGALRVLFDQTAPAVETDTYKPVFLRQSDEQLRQSIDKRANERLIKQRAEREKLIEASRDQHKIERAAAIR